jgi:Spy/CpxP family protein refolding chaperone
MPGRNGMGPMGQGPRTGRGMGWCSGSHARLAEAAGSFAGMGRGGGRCGGWGHRHGFRATGLTRWQRAPQGWRGRGSGGSVPFPGEDVVATLRQQLHDLEQAFRALQSKVQELDNPAPSTASKERA